MRGEKKEERCRPADGRKLDPDGEYFRDGVALLGEEKRSLVAKLKKQVGLDRARAIIEAAKGKADPIEYIGGAMRNTQIEADEEADFWKRVQ